MDAILMQTFRSGIDATPSARSSFDVAPKSYGAAPAGVSVAAEEKGFSKTTLVVLGGVGVLLAVGVVGAVYLLASKSVDAASQVPVPQQAAPAPVPRADPSEKKAKSAARIERERQRREMVNARAGIMESTDSEGEGVGSIHHV
jgi:hypothetical protein